MIEVNYIFIYLLNKLKAVSFHFYLTEFRLTGVLDPLPKLKIYFLLVPLGTPYLLTPYNYYQIN